MNKLETVLLLLLLPLVSCSTPVVTEVAMSEDREQLHEMFEGIELLIGEPVCATVEQCRLIGVGVKACGGVKGYLAYSIWNRRGSMIRETLA